MIDYDLTKIRAIAFDVDGVLSPAQIPMHPSGEPMRMVNIKDGYAIQLAVKHGYNIAIITGAYTKAVEVRFSGLGVKDIFIGAGVKLPILMKWMEKRGLERENVAYVGDDIPDMQVMRYVGLAVAPADAAPEIKELARYISPIMGGYGCAREIIEQVMKAQGNWLSDERAFGW